MENASARPASAERPFLPRPVQRITAMQQAVGIMLLLTLLTGCAVRAPRSMSGMPESDLTEADGKLLVTSWQQQLGEYIERFGNGDPAVLLRLPGLRSTGTLRPARITFGATDIGALVRERDGFDVQGLLLGRQVNTTGAWYVFVVGVIERRGYRSVAVADVRLAAMSVSNGPLVWETDASDAQALAYYRRSVDAAAPLRFPADKDHFGMTSCGSGICVEESGSGARWTLQFRVDAPHSVLQQESGKAARKEISEGSNAP